MVSIVGIHVLMMVLVSSASYINCNLAFRGRGLVPGLRVSCHNYYFVDSNALQLQTQNQALSPGKQRHLLSPFMNNRVRECL